MTAPLLSPRNLIFVATIAALLEGSSLAAASPPEPTAPGTRPTLLWAALQLIPSPEVVADGSSVHAGLRWQVTPLLYSFGMNRKLVPWRSLIAEPIVRHAGSIELFVSPEYLGKPGAFAERWLLRGGVRSYFPLLQKGEYLSTSLGASLLHVDHHLGAAVSAGIYALYGFLGAEITYCPTPAVRSTTVTLAIRVF